MKKKVRERVAIYILPFLDQQKGTPLTLNGFEVRKNLIKRVAKRIRDEVKRKKF